MEGIFLRGNQSVEGFGDEILETFPGDPVQLSVQEDETRKMFPEIDSSFVEYYFNAYVDREIDPMVFCENVPANKRDSLFANQQINCPPGCGPAPTPAVATDGSATYQSPVSEDDGPFGDEC